MSPRSSPGSGGPYRKPRVDVYTWMLFLALVAIVIACVCLYLEVADYGDQPYKLALSAPVAQESPLMVAAGCGSPGPDALDLPPWPVNSIHG